MSTATRHETAGPSSGPIPPLRHGDRLTMAEFERRFEAMPRLKKAELLDGVVYIPFSEEFLEGEGDVTMASPVSYTEHSSPHFRLVHWLSLYWDETPGVLAGVDGTIRLDTVSMPQPDAFLFILPEHGGQARIGEDGYLAGAPDLAAEVAASTASYDLRAKLEVFRRNGVREYVVWRTRDRALDWFLLRDGRYERLAPGADGLIRSEVFPGLWLDPAALIEGGRGRIGRALRQGLASPEHAAFIETLRRAAVPEAP